MKTNFVKLRWLFTMLLFVTTMIMPTMMLAKSIDLKIPEGDGAGTPYKIGTAEELYWFAGLVRFQASKRIYLPMQSSRMTLS